MGDPAVSQLQVIDGDGEFRSREVEVFMSQPRLANGRQDYQVVAIMGPQSSGKSTLLNYVFGTKFVMMDALAGRSQTTKGIWMAASEKIDSPNTLVMDLEGADGRERGEDDTNFERQSALFALAVADVLLVNIWCHDVGREQGSGKPLLKTIFQVNLKLFAPDPDRSRTVLLFVFRDKTKTPLSRLVETMEGDLEKMWAAIAKPAQYSDSALSDFFDVQYTALSHFEEKPEDFAADAVMLRRRFTQEADDSLARRQADRLPADALALSMRSIWEVIRSQKDLNLPAHKVMVANIRCSEIKDDQLQALEADQAWASLVEKACGGVLVPEFGATAANLLDSCMQGYMSEAVYFDAGVRAEKGEELMARLTEMVEAPVKEQAGALGDEHIRKLQQKLKSVLADGSTSFAASADKLRKETLAEYATTFQRDVRLPGFPWDGQTELAAFSKLVDSHIMSVRDEQVASAMAAARRTLAASLSGSCIALLDACPPNLWQRLHALAGDAAKVATQSVDAAVAGLGLSDAESKSLANDLSKAAWERVEGHVREGALTRMSRMKDRFAEEFTMDRNKTPRTWGANVDVPAIAKSARESAASVLSALTAVRPLGAESSKAFAAIDSAVMQLVSNESSNGAADGFTDISSADSGQVDILSAAAWPGVPESHVLLQPHEVRASWREFMSSSNVMVQQALATQQANKLAGNRGPPLWAILAILVLGWNEFMGLLCSPTFLVLGVLLFLFGRTLYFELDVDGEMAKGSLPGAISLAHKIGPASRAVVNRTIQSLQKFASHLPENASRAQAYLASQASDNDSSTQAKEIQIQERKTAGTGTGMLKQRRPATTEEDSAHM
mmetsp:Transcript_17254/g.51819  ORF Transcript_17254/g.51819 Transcript_17254/m.51819 type:complete len:843 (-) Transcript_17254:172-2700(-)